MDLLDERVLEEFGITAKYIKKIKYIYNVKTDRGSFIIKKTDADSDKIRFVNDVKNRISRKGCRMFDEFLTAENGEPFAEVDGERYIMTGAVRQAPEADYGSTGDVANIVRGFGRFHRAAVFGSEKELEGYYGRDMGEYFNNLFGKLKRVRRAVYRKRRLDDTDYTFLRSFEYYYDMCVKALAGMEKSGYRACEAKARQGGQIIINNADEENMFLYPDGVFMTDMMRMGVGARLEDLRQVILRYMKKNSELKLRVEDIIKIYREVNTFSDEEIALLRYMLLFPERYIKTYSDYYGKGYVFTPVNVKEAVRKLEGDRERNFAYIMR